LKTSNIQQFHNYLKANSKVIFEREIEKRNIIDFAMSLNSKTVDHLTECSFSTTWKETVRSGQYDEYMSFVDILILRLGEEIPTDDEIHMMFECKKYIWEYKPDLIARLLKRIGMELDEAITRIRNQYIHGGSIDHTVMARSHNNSKQEKNESMEAFVIAKETSKRDTFLEQLRETYY
jgi:hypothetical protein